MANNAAQLAFDFSGTACQQRFLRGSPMQWMVAQLEVSFQVAPPPKRHRGLGKLGTTGRVLELLRSQANVWLLHRQLRAKLGCSKGALDWALHWLRRNRMIQTAPCVRPACRPVMLYRIADH